MTTLIVGACQAGVQLAASLRELGDTEPIILVGEESRLPYQRPPLSKAFLKGDVDFESLEFRNDNWYADHAVDLVLGERITEISRDPSGGVARSASGREFRFSRLALTTGASCRTLPIPGAELSGVFTLRTEQDSRELAAAMGLHNGEATDVVVIGGGFIGLEVAASARADGKTVTVLEAASRLVGRVVSEATSAFYLDAHTRRGTRVVLNAQVAGIVGDNGTVTGVELGSGEVIPAQVVLIGVGVIARTELADQLGLAIDNGIVVDAHARCSDGLTVAAGDCTMQPNFYARGTGSSIRLESVQNAVDQAKIAAATLLGTTPAEEHRAVPWFWSDQADLKLQIAGLSTGYDHTVVRGEPGEEKFTVLYYRDGVLIAADSVNAPLDHIAVKNALNHGAHIPAEAAADTTQPLKKLVVTDSVDA